jgi:hypothetical protein
MKHYITKQITTERLIKTTCDICGKDVENKHIYQRDEASIKHTKSEEYPEAQFGKTIEIDICGDCFSDKVFPFIQSIACGKLEYEEFHN